MLKNLIKVKVIRILYKPLIFCLTCFLIGCSNNAKKITNYIDEDKKFIDLVNLYRTQIEECLCNIRLSKNDSVLIVDSYIDKCYEPENYTKKKVLINDIKENDGITIGDFELDSKFIESFVSSNLSSIHSDNNFNGSLVSSIVTLQIKDYSEDWKYRYFVSVTFNNDNPKIPNILNKVNDTIFIHVLDNKK